MGQYDMGSTSNPRTFSPEGYGNTVVGGGARGNGTYSALSQMFKKKQPAAPQFLGGFVPKFQDAMREGVQGYGNMVGVDFRKSIGNMLGDLNSIGALRSGGVQSGINDAMDSYGRQVGNYASMATRDAVGMAQGEHDMQQERDFRERERNAAKRRSKLGVVGKLLGGAVGLVNPVAGAVIGGMTR